MKSRFILICIILLLFITIKTVSSEDTSIGLNGTYGGSGTDIAFQGIQTLDGGYALAGTTNSFGNGGFDYWLVKTDRNGTIVWDKYYGGPNDDAANSIVQTSDGGYALAGYTNSFENNDFDFFLIKTDSEGEIEFYKNYGGILEDRATYIIETSDCGYALAGYTNSFNKNNFDFFLVRTNKYGDIQWSKTYGGYDIEKASHLIQTRDDGFLIVGEIASVNKDNYDFWVVKTDANGSEEWNRTYGGINFDSAKAAVQSYDNGFLIVGETNSFGTGNYDFWVVKTDVNGSEEWNRTFGWKDSDHAQAVVQTNDKGFLVAGYSERLLYYNFQLFKISFNGYMQFEKNFSGNADIFSNSITNTEDNEYLLTGFVLIEDPNMDFFMLKTNLSASNNSNLYPIANAGNDESIEVGENLFFNTSGFDSDGEIIEYKWDFDGDGTYDWESSNPAIAIHNYSKPGVYKSYLEVTDNNNSKDIDMKVVSVSSKENYATHNQMNISDWSYFVLIVIIFIILLGIFLYSKQLKQKTFGNSFYKKIESIMKINKWHKYILLSFVTITIIKLLISLFFSKPSIYTDEFIYGVVANEISEGNFQILGKVPFSPVFIPTAYSYLLSPAYLFKNNMDFVYHGFLLINTILTSLLIIPTFIIMRKFVNEKISFTTSIIVSTLPIILAHNFILFSENLFYLLFILSCLFVIKTFTYKKFDRWFIFLSFLTGLLIGLLIMTRALGIVCLGGLICIFIYKFIKNRKLSNLKYSLVFFPFIPAILIGYILYGDKLLFVGYPGSGYVDTLGIIISSFSNIIKFLRLIINEINYFVIMGYIIFIAFTIFLIFNRKKIIEKQKEELSIFLVYSFSSIFFLIVITAIHIFPGENPVYSRYVSPGLPIIFMTGAIGLCLFNKIKEQNKYFKLALITIMLSFIYIIFFPLKIVSIANNMDLVWINYLSGLKIFNCNLLQISLILFIIMLGCYLIILFIKQIKKEQLMFFKKIIDHKSIIFVVAIIISILFFIPSLNNEISLGGGPDIKSKNELIKWFIENDPDADVIFEGPYGAFSGGGMDNWDWHQLYVNLYFWLPEVNIRLIVRDNLSKLIKSKNISADYIVSTHDLSDYYPLVQDYYMDAEIWPIKKQPYVDWHIYKIK